MDRLRLRIAFAAVFAAVVAVAPWATTRGGDPTAEPSEPPPVAAAAEPLAGLTAFDLTPYLVQAKLQRQYGRLLGVVPFDRTGCLAFRLRSISMCTGRRARR